jgi:hypothetical protein
MSISSGFSQTCTSSTGGLVNIWISDVDNVDQFTLSGSEYNNVSMLNSEVFYRYQFEQDSAGLRENGGKESRSATVTHEVEFCSGCQRSKMGCWI